MIAAGGSVFASEWGQGQQQRGLSRVPSHMQELVDPLGILCPQERAVLPAGLLCCSTAQHQVPPPDPAVVAAALQGQLASRFI